MQLDKDLYNDINEYCKLNGLKTHNFIHKILNEAFLKEKYGDSPFFNLKTETESECDNKNISEIEIQEEIKSQITKDSSVIAQVENYEENITPTQNNDFKSNKISEEYIQQPKEKRKLK